MLCLNVLGSCSRSMRSGFHTVNVRPSAVHEMMWSLDASETRFHVFLRGLGSVGGGGERRGRGGRAARGKRTNLAAEGGEGTTRRRGCAGIAVRGGGVARSPAETRARADASRARAGRRAGRRAILARGRAPSAATRDHTWRESASREKRGKKMRRRRGAHHRNGETFTVENGLAPALPGCALTTFAVPAALAATMIAGAALSEVRAGVE